MVLMLFIPAEAEAKLQLVILKPQFRHSFLSDEVFRGIFEVVSFVAQ